MGGMERPTKTMNAPVTAWDTRASPDPSAGSSCPSSRFIMHPRTKAGSKTSRWMGTTSSIALLPM